MTDRSHALAGIIWLTGFLLLAPNLVLAGPNEGGTLILHAKPGLVFTNDTPNYCGMSALDSCSAAVTSVDWDPGRKIVFHVIAAFPPESSPRLKSVSFGIDYDPAKFMLAARGTCADFEFPDGTWPAHGTGTSQSWTTGAQTGLLTEVYWFAGYAYSEQYVADSTSVALIPHPLQHGVFVDDAFPSEVDTIAAYGRLGFGTQGLTPCPNQDPGPDGPGDPPPGGNEDEATLPNLTDLISVQISPELMDFGPDPYRDKPISEIAFRNPVLRSALRDVGAVSIQRTCPGATSDDLVAHDAEDRPFPLADLTTFYRIRFPNPHAAVGALARLRRTSLLGTPSVVPDIWLEASTVSDSLFDNFDSCYVADSQWPLRNDGLRPDTLHNWGCEHARVGYDIRVEEAWGMLDLSYGDPTVVIGMVDTGIRGGNSEQPSVYHNDLNVIPLTPSQRALIQQHPTVDWCSTHGTFMAGMAAAKTDNISGIAGVCGGCSLLDIENAGCDPATTLCSTHNDICNSINGLAWPPHAYAAAHNVSLPANSKLAAILVSAAGSDSGDYSVYSPENVAMLWHLFTHDNIALVAPSADFSRAIPYTCAPANIPFFFGVGGFTWDGRFWSGSTTCWSSPTGTTIGYSEWPLKTGSFVAVSAPASGTTVGTAPGGKNAYGWIKGRCSTAAAFVTGAVGLLQALSKQETGAETDVEDILGVLRATARPYRTDPTVGAECPVGACPPEFYGSGMVDVGAAARLLEDKWHGPGYFDEHEVTRNSYGWQFLPVDTVAVGDTTWVQYRASAPVYFASRSDGRFLAWARKKSAYACAGYPSLMSQRVQLARLGIRDCYLYRPDDQWSNAKITGYTYAWRLGSGPLHFLIAEDQMRLTYCKVRDAIIGVGNTGGSDAPALRVTPNPGVSAVSIFLAGPVSSALRVEAYDAAGRMVRRFSVRGGDVANRIQWDCRDQLGRTVPNGAYWIRAITGSGVRTARLVVLR